MKYGLCILLILSLSKYSSAQAGKVKTDSCRCTLNTVVKLTKEANDDEMYGTVLVGLVIDTNCLCDKTIIIQSVSPAKDKVALATADDLKNQWNKCMKACMRRKCESKTLKQPVSFTNQDEE